MLDRIDDDVWTPRLVGDELITAIRWAVRAAGRTGPAGYGSNMPALLLMSEEREIEGWPQIAEFEPEPMRRSYSPAEVSRFERILTWPMAYLRESASDKEAMWFFRLWVECKITKGMKFDGMLNALGLSRATAYRKRDKVLSEIAKGLTRDGIARGRH